MFAYHRRVREGVIFFLADLQKSHRFVYITSRWMEVKDLSYRYNTGHLTRQQQEIIRQRDKADEERRREAEKKRQEESKKKTEKTEQAN